VDVCVCADLVHIMCISQRYRAINVHIRRMQVCFGIYYTYIHTHAHSVDP
jgi:hypothetical protein